MKKVEFSEYVNGRIYNSHNGKIVFDDGLINKLNVCKDLTYKMYEIKLDFEYKNTTILYQATLDNLTYTLTLNVPKAIYEENPEKFENLFKGVYFLKNQKKIEKLLESD